MEEQASKTTVRGSVMVVGGGIAGMQAALDMANSGYYVYMVEKSPAIGGAMAQLFEVMIWGTLKSKKGGKTFGNMAVKSSQANLLLMKELLEAGKVVPVLDQRFSLSQVPDAIRYLETGSAKGKVVINVAGNGMA